MYHALGAKILGNTKRDFSLNLLKIAIIGFVAFSLLGNIEPYYEGRDAYVHALASIYLSNGIMERTNPLLEETGRGEFVGDRWLITDYNTAIPRLPGIGIAVFGAISYIFGGYYGLFYLTPIFTIILLILSERIATNLFGKYVGLFTLLLLGTSNLVFRNSITLQTESIFSIFFLLGCFYLVKYMRGRSDFYLLFSSIFFAASAAFRLQGIITFPVELIILTGFFIVKKIHERNTNSINSDNQIFVFKKKTIIKAYTLILIPWIIYFSVYMIFYDHYFGDPLTNYGQVAGFQSYESSPSALFTVKNEDLENVKQYSKYLLPYQISATYNNLDNNFEDVFGSNWIGIIALSSLFFSVFISIRVKNNRIELISFIFFIVFTVWFYSALTSPERAASGVPGRFLIPVFILSSMIFGFLLREFFKLKLNKANKIPIFTLKGIKIFIFGLVCLFMVFAFYFSPPSQILIKDGLVFNDPSELASRYPLRMEGLTLDSVIMVIHTDWAVDYGVIPFQPDPDNLDSSSQLLEKILRDGNNVYTFKRTSYPGEKDIFKFLINNQGIVLKDYSPTFCKMMFSEKNSIGSDKVCLIE